MKIDELIEKANKENVTILKNENNQVLLEIKNFNDASLFGSKRWGITHKEVYYDKFIEKGDKQYFIFDFDKDIKDSNFIIGITIDSNKKIKHAYSQDSEIILVNEIPKIFVDNVLNIKRKNKIRP